MTDTLHAFAASRIDGLTVDIKRFYAERGAEVSVQVGGEDPYYQLDLAGSGELATVRTSRAMAPRHEYLAAGYRPEEVEAFFQTADNRLTCVIRQSDWRPR